MHVGSGILVQTWQKHIIINFLLETLLTLIYSLKFDKKYTFLH
jgi:hypothetical protein